jgi:type-F conjugative transfer system pilin assembly protein TrbC
MEETQLLSWIIFVCIFSCVHSYAKPSDHTTSARMQKAYESAKGFALSLPGSSPHTMNDAKDPKKETEENHKTCSASVDLSKDVMPCDGVKNSRSQNKDDQNSEKSSSDKILIFVSLSMPKESLKQLVKEAILHNAVLILRGLKNNSFKETVEFIGSIGEEKYGNSSQGFEGGIEINPILFDTHNITHVPVFMHVKKDQEQSRLSGNVSLGFASQKLMAADIKEPL